MQLYISFSSQTRGPPSHPPHVPCYNYADICEAYPCLVWRSWPYRCDCDSRDALQRSTLPYGYSMMGRSALIKVVLGHNNCRNMTILLLLERYASLLRLLLWSLQQPIAVRGTLGMYYATLPMSQSRPHGIGGYTLWWSTLHPDCRPSRLGIFLSLPSLFSIRV
jgi:hypothetical protein